MSLVLATTSWPESRLLGQGQGWGDGQASRYEGPRLGHRWEEVLVWVQLRRDPTGVRTRDSRLERPRHADAAAAKG